MTLRISIYNEEESTDECLVSIVPADPRAEIERKSFGVNPSESQAFTLRRGDLLIIRVDD